MPEDRTTTRRSVLKAAGATAIAGSGLAGTAAAGGKGGKGGKGKKKIPICHCPPGRKGKNCKTLYLPKKAAKSHLKQHPYDSKGKCKKKKKPKKPKKGKKKIPICHCPPGRKGKNCKTLYLPKKAAKSHLKQHPYDSKGKCKKKKKPKKGKKSK